jgi:hypothetical protein
MRKPELAKAVSGFLSYDYAKIVLYFNNRFTRYNPSSGKPLTAFLHLKDRNDGLSREVKRAVGQPGDLTK